MSEEQARLAEEALAAAAAGPQPGPHLELSRNRLDLATSAPSPSSGGDSFLPATGPSSTSASASFSLKHRGTAAVYFTWVPQPTVFPPFSTSGAGGGTAAPSGYSLSKTSGVVLPGETVDFKATFRPDKPGEPWAGCWRVPLVSLLFIGRIFPLPVTYHLLHRNSGVYSQQWTLSTMPVLPDWRPITVAARGLCLPHDASGVERAAIEKDVAEKEKMAKVRCGLPGDKQVDT